VKSPAFEPDSSLDSLGAAGLLDCHAIVRSMKHCSRGGPIGRWYLSSVQALLVCMASNVSWAESNGSTLAKDVASEGFGAFETGRYEEANEKLSRALDLVGVPTIALYAARTNVKLGNWVKASELYLLASRLSPRSAADISRLQAQYEAEKERAALLARVPRLTIELKGTDLETVQVTLDAEPIPGALLGANQLVDPGHHVIRATRDRQTVSGELDIAERQHKTTTLHFAPRERDSSQSQTLPSIATSTATTQDDTDLFGPLPTTDDPMASNESHASVPTTPSTTNAPAQSTVLSKLSTAPGDPSARVDALDADATVRTLGWVGVGLGGVGLLVGVTTGLMAMSVRSDLLDGGQCSNRSCSDTMSGQVDRYNLLRTWSSIGFVAGGLFAATGTTLLLSLPTGKDDRRARLVVGPSSAAVVGHF
jgi:hypothetical protein